MLVMAVMAMVAAFVLPNMFRPATASLHDTARHLARLLHVAAEEAQLRGVPLRWQAYADPYEFQIADSKGAWQTLSEAPFAAQKFPDDIQISELRLADGYGFNFAGYSGAESVQDKMTQANDSESIKNKDKKLIGSVVFMSDGMLSVGDVFLHGAAGDVVIELRPGPAGIRVRKAGP